MNYGAAFTIPNPVCQCGVICSDGVELMGLVSADSDQDRSAAILFIPGMFDNAYQQRLNHALLLDAVSSSFSCLLANSRGQDYYSYQRYYPDASNPSEYEWKRIGSSFERVREADRDIDAWLHYLSERNSGRSTILVGHSHGAIKVANYMMEHHPSAEHISAVVLLSPSDDIGSRQAKLGSRYEEALRLAQARVDSGEGDTLMPDWVFSSPISAGTYYEGFGPDSPLATFAFHSPEVSPLSKPGACWAQPTFVLFAENDGATGVVSSTEACAISERLLADTERCNTRVVEGTDHHYRGAETEVSRAVIEWIDQTARL
jgi:predicted esterase